MKKSDDNGEAERVRVSVIIPTLNEADNLQHVMTVLPPVVDEVLIVDGGSTDGTIEEARRLRHDVRIIEELRPGKGRALRTGFEEATGDILVMIDADGSMDPREIPAMVAVLEAGADVVKGSRFLQGAGTDDMGLLRRSGNTSLRLLVRALFGGRYSDLCYGYMAFWRDVLPAFEGDAPGFEVETFLNVRALAAGLRVAEIPSFERNRISGESHLNTFRDGWRVLLTIFRERQVTARSRWGQGVPRPTPARQAALTIDLTDDASGGMKVLELHSSDRAERTERTDSSAVASRPSNGNT
jgi:glycosyltransferase involved in cell wall biosynthesis